jgi:ATP phosphoribosyltransferase
MTEKLVFALPSKGRLKDDSIKALAAAGLTLAGLEFERGYRSALREAPNVDIRFVSASEIAKFLGGGDIHFGVTGNDLIDETMPDPAATVRIVKPLGFGRADLVVAAPKCWIDVETFADLEEVAHFFRREHGRRLRVATKYVRLTRAAFARHGIVSYRIVESLGATEGTPAAGLADLIVDITTTGATIDENGLKALREPPLLRSEANLVESLAAFSKAPLSRPLREARAEILRRFAAGPN